MSHYLQHCSRGAPEPGEIACEYVVVETNHNLHFVHRSEAARIADVLDRWWHARWIEFVDIHGTLVRIRVRDVVEMRDSSTHARISALLTREALAAEDRAIRRQIAKLSNEEEAE